MFCANRAEGGSTTLRLVDATALMLRLCALAEERTRVLALIDSLSSGDAAAWVAVLGDILSRAHDDLDARRVLEALRGAAGDPALGYEARKKLYEAAIHAQRPAIARLFLTASPSAPLPVALTKQLGPERPLRPTTRPLSLGERRALARTHDREQLVLLLRDPHPMVVAVVLDNPHLTEPDVVRIAAMRPAAPAALATVARHRKWSVRHAVKRALMLNPMLPLSDAIRLAPTMLARDLADVAADPALPDALRAHAAELLPRRLSPH
jgi:hypothetical protein